MNFFLFLGGDKLISELRWIELFSNELNELIKERNLTQKDLAEMSCLAESTVSQYIHGLRVPNLRAIINMSYALDIDPGELIDFGQRIE